MKGKWKTPEFSAFRAPPYIPALSSTHFWRVSTFYTTLTTSKIDFDVLLLPEKEVCLGRGNPGQTKSLRTPSGLAKSQTLKIPWVLSRNNPLTLSAPTSVPSRHGLLGHLMKGRTFRNLSSSPSGPRGKARSEKAFPHLNCHFTRVSPARFKGSRRHPRPFRVRSGTLARAFFRTTHYQVDELGLHQFSLPHYPESFSDWSRLDEPRIIFHVIERGHSLTAVTALVGISPKTGVPTSIYISQPALELTPEFYQTKLITSGLTRFHPCLSRKK